MTDNEETWEDWQRQSEQRQRQYEQEKRDFEQRQRDFEQEIARLQMETARAERRLVEAKRRQLLVERALMAGSIVLILVPFALVHLTRNTLWLIVPTLAGIGWTIKGNGRRAFAYYRSLWPWAWLPALGWALAGFVATASLFLIIYLVIPPVARDWSLGTLFGIGSEAGRNTATIGLLTPWLLPFYAPILAFALPILAWIEELVFRQGTRGWRDALWRSLIFGLVHLTAGVSLGPCLALTGPGLVFTIVYFRAMHDPRQQEHLAQLPAWARDTLAPDPSPPMYGVFRATQAHFVYNALAIGLLVVVVLFSASSHL